MSKFNCFVCWVEEAYAEDEEIVRIVREWCEDSVSYRGQLKYGPWFITGVSEKEMEDETMRIIKEHPGLLSFEYVPDVPEKEVVSCMWSCFKRSERLVLKPYQ